MDVYMKIRMEKFVYTKISHWILVYIDFEYRRI
jgi:hypothetical protein